MVIKQCIFCNKDYTAKTSQKYCLDCNSYIEVECSCGCGTLKQIKKFNIDKENYIKGHALKNKYFSLEHRNKISNGNKGKKYSNERKEKMKIISKNNYLKDPTLKQRIGNKTKERMDNPEWKKQWLETNYFPILTDE